MEIKDIVAKPLDVTGSIGTQCCDILTLHRIPFSHSVTQQTTDIDAALGNDRLGHQVVLYVTYR
jgi:hypothetical protein